MLLEVPRGMAVDTLIVTATLDRIEDREPKS